MRWIAGMLVAVPLLGADPLQLSLKRTVEIATSPEGSAKIQLSGEQVKQAESRSAQARAALLPDLSSQWYLQNRTLNLAANGLNFGTIAGSFGFAFPTIVPPFNTMDARVSGSQSVFDFASIRRFQASKVQVAAVRSDASATEEQVAAQVARAYLGAVRAVEDVETAKANIALSEASLAQAENQKRAGTGTGIEITRARVQLANDRQRMLVAQNALRAAQLQLLRAAGLRLDTQIELTDKLQFVPVDDLTLDQARKQALALRPDLKAQQNREDNVRLSASAVRMERLPSVAAMADYGSIGTGFTNAAPTRTYGISVKIPLFDGGRRDARRGESASQLRAEAVRTNDLKEQIELDVRLALDALASARDQVNVAKDGLALADSELVQARRRYEAGVANGLEVTDAQTRLERARDNQTVALYNYNLARIDLAQAMGNVRGLVR